MSTDNTYTTEEPKGPRCEERRRRIKYYRVSDTATADPLSASNYPFTGMLIANTAKGSLPALRRSVRSKYTPHIGAKQLARLKK